MFRRVGSRALGLEWDATTDFRETSIGVEFYEAVPPDQLLTFMLPIYETPRRILAWVHERTLCYPASSTFCIDKTGNALQQKDCLRSLNETARQFAEKHGAEPVVLMSKSAISRGFARLKKFGLVRFDDEQGRIYLCGKVTPSPDVYKLSDQNSISPALREVLDQCSVDERSEIVQGLLERQAQLKEAVAAAVRKVRQEHRQAEDEFLAEHGIAKVPGGKEYARLHVHATPPTENQQITVEELRVHVTREPNLPLTSLAGSAPARGDELHVHATSDRKISAEDQPPTAAAEASAGTDGLHVRSTDRSKLPSGGSVAGAPANGEELNVHATPKTSTDETAPEHPTAAVPTFKEWHQLYPANRLDAQKADQIFKALDDFDKIKATDGLRAHLVCERWRRTPDYIPLGAALLRLRLEHHLSIG
jgi:hypothetical protein